MGNSSSHYPIRHGVLMKWEDSRPLLSLWFDVDDDIIEVRRAPENTHRGYPIFKLQKRRLSSSARIVARNYVLSRQVTIIETASVHDARREYQHLVHNVCDAGDLTSPETVKEALENRETLPGIRFQSLINPHNNLFPERLLQPLHPGWDRADFQADIIFVHGLGGDSQTTWHNEDGLWPIVWLLDDQVGIRSLLGRYNIQDLPPANRIRVLTVIHHANMLGIGNESDPRCIAQRLVELLSHAGVGSKPIVWITHSLGGLIVKEILFTCQHGLWPDIFRSTKGVIFFGTPHCGATWATCIRQANRTHDSPGLKYLDPAPSIGAQAGNRDRLQELNEFFSQTTIPFLNFSEGTMCSLPVLSFLSGLINPIVVSDAQAHIIGSITVGEVEVETQMAMGTIPPRVHYNCPDRHQMNIARPSDREHATYRLTKTYVANWLQRRTTVTDVTGRVNWDTFSRNIVDTVRMYSLVIERITNADSVRVLNNISAASASVLGTMTINQFLILILFLSGGLITTGFLSVGAGAAIGGPFGAAVGLVGVAAAAATGAALASRLAPRVRQLLRNNLAVIREMVNLISAYVMPDFEDIISNAQSEQDLDATLNRLRGMVAQTICCVFLEPTEPDVTLRDSHAIQAAVGRHADRVRQAETVIGHLSRALGGATMINSDEIEERAQEILTDAFIHQALHSTATDLA